MDLLTSSEWLEIRSTLSDVMETFFKTPVLYVQRRQRTLNMFHENRMTDFSAIPYPLLGLKVEKTTDDQAKVEEYAKGFLNNAEGYVLLSYKVMLDYTPSFIDADGKSVIIPNQDTIVVQGEELTIIGVNLVGPTESDFQLVKIHYKRNIANDNPVPVQGIAVDLNFAPLEFGGLEPSLINDTSLIIMPPATI